MTNILEFFLYRLGLLTTHGGHIPDDKLFVKLGGDHGQKSMKFAFQLANLEKPNSSKKTVVFCIFEVGTTSELQWKNTKSSLQSEQRKKCGMF